MTNIKSQLPGIPASGPVPRREDTRRAARGTPVRDTGFSTGGADSPQERPSGRADSKTVARFIETPQAAGSWLSNPVFGAAIAQVSGEIAPRGVAEDRQSQYVASVLETHLKARRQLSKQLNALIRA